MKAGKWLSVWTIAFVLAMGSMGAAWAGEGGPVFSPSSELSVGGSLACGAMACVDVFKVNCGAGSHYLGAQVVDNDSSEDNLSLTLTALTPTIIKGTTLQTFIPFGSGAFGSSPPIYLARNASTAGAMSAYAAISNISNIFVDYIFYFQCFKLDFFTTTATTVTTVQNQ